MGKTIREKQRVRESGCKPTRRPIGLWAPRPLLAELVHPAPSVASVGDHRQFTAALSSIELPFFLVYELLQKT